MDDTQSEQALSATLQLCNQLDIQVADDGPATTMTFLGIEIDPQQQIRLPHEKLANLTSLLNKWMPPRLPSSPRPPRRTIKKRDLLSLIGLLNHAASVVRPGRTFLRSIIHASTTVDHLDHHVTLHAHARADIIWWHTFINRWNGISTLPKGIPTHFTYSDASGSWGCGAFWGSRSNGRGHADMHIVVIEAAIWGHHWRGSRVCCYCDNIAVVFALNKGSAKYPQLMRLLRTLFFFSALHDFSISARHIAGSQNTAADALSRNNIPLFMSLQPHTQVAPSRIPQELQELVLNRSLHWTSPAWTKLFEATLRTVSLQQLDRHMPQPSEDIQPSANRQL